VIGDGLLTEHEVARDLLAAPPTVPLYRLSELHAYHRLARVVEGKSYIDALLGGRS